MLIPEDRDLIRSSVREIADVLEDLTRAAIAGPLVTGSIADRYARSEFNVASFGDGPIVGEANFSMMLATTAGVDHVRTYCDALDSATATVSMTTLTRGAVEAFSKSFYLLGADSAADLVARHLAISKLELSHPLKHSRFRDYEGNEFDGPAYPRAHDFIRESVTLPRPPSPGSQSRVEALLSAGMSEGRAGHERYSQLSGAAHAVTTALGMYLEPGDTGRYVYPREIAFEHCGFLFVSVTAVAELVLSVFDLNGQERSRWRAARERSETSMRTIVATDDA